MVYESADAIAMFVSFYLAVSYELRGPSSTHLMDTYAYFSPISVIHAEVLVWYMFTPHAMKRHKSISKRLTPGDI